MSNSGVVVQREDMAVLRHIAIGLVVALLLSGCTTKAYEEPELGVFL